MMGNIDKKLVNKVDNATVYTKTEMNTKLSGKEDAGVSYPKADMDKNM